MWINQKRADPAKFQRLVTTAYLVSVAVNYSHIYLLNLICRSAEYLGFLESITAPSVREPGNLRFQGLAALFPHHQNSRIPVSQFRVQDRLHIH